VKLGRISFGEKKPRANAGEAMRAMFNTGYNAVSEVERLRSRVGSAEKLLREVHGPRGGWSTPTDWWDRVRAWLADSSHETDAP
jgi:hypothetical protein